MTLKEMKIETSDLESGMVLARNVEVDGNLLTTKGNKINKRMKECFLRNKIMTVWVYNISNISRISVKIYNETVDKFNEVITLVQEGEFIKRDDINNIIDKYVELPNRFSIIRYICEIKNKDQYTCHHSLNVCNLAIMIGKNSGFQDLKTLAQAALLHDIGKVKVNNNILNKNGSLTDDEWNIMKKHPYYGYKYLTRKSDFCKDVLAGVLHHHEKFNGIGYPTKLKTEKIPEISRIITIADVFDALTSDRPYRDKVDIFETIQLMYESKEEYDLRYLLVFIKSMLDFLIGETVLLSNNKLGKIVLNKINEPFKPLIQTEDGFIDLAKDNDIHIKSVLNYDIKTDGISHCNRQNNDI